jgi:hypothetical protein
MLRNPTWLTNKVVDEIAKEAEEYHMTHSECIEALVFEEKRSGNALSASNPRNLLDMDWLLRVGLAYPLL